jgi:hypothetical protein
MDQDRKSSSGNVLPFDQWIARKFPVIAAVRLRTAGIMALPPRRACASCAPFVGIKNRKLREDLVEMLEGASRVRQQVPAKE